jgi:hypothetical protein|tara:strand:- start:788 stop:1075 length:288 start_codon:yes stop_codon:yes gene_type:complete
MSKDVRKIKEDLIESGKEAAQDLMRVAKEKIVVKGKDPLAADKLKNAAAAKKMAIFDAFEILDRIQIEENKLIEEDQGVKANQKTDFLSAEERTK